jgi:FAD/FMN-containing dehydrogenase
MDALFAKAALSRRGFLVGSSALAVGAGLGGRSFIRPALAQARQPSDAAWRHLAEKLSGPVLRAKDFNLSHFAHPVNLRYAADLPDAVALCRTAEDVAAAITWCNENHVPLVVQSGGHSYAGYSMRKGGLMINLRLMRDASTANGSVTVAGGALNQKLYALLEQSGAAITHGRCLTVGAAGFVLGGGIGFNMRAHGLACDQLTASEIVTADGQIRSLRADAGGIEGDLFWACRGGGGGNFGVSTSFTLATFAAEPLTVFDLTWTAATPHTDKIALALIADLEKAPRDLGLGTRLSLQARPPKDRARGETIAISLLGQIKASAKALDDLLARTYAIAKPQRHMVWADAPYWAAQSMLEEGYGDGYFQERSTFAAPGQAERAIAHGLRHLMDWPGTGGDADLRFFQTGGKVNDLDAKGTAFAHRTSAWIMDVGLSWAKADSAHTVARARAWQDRFYAALRPFSTGGAYVNFPDPSLADWREAYYGENLQRLEDIKKEVDPKRLLDFAQAI